MAVFGTSSMPGTPTAVAPSPVLVRRFMPSAGALPLTSLPPSPVTRAAPTSLPPSPVARATPMTTLGIAGALGSAGPRILAPSSVRTASTSLVTQIPASPSGVRTLLPTAVPLSPTVKATSAQQKTLRIASYRAAAGAEAQFLDVMSQVEAHAAAVPGLLDFRGGMSGSDYTAMMVFQSQDALDSYRAGQHKQFLSMLKPFMEGPPDFDYQPPLATHIVLQPPGNGHIMILVGYKCAAGKEAAWRACYEAYDDIMAQIANGAIHGLVVCDGAFLNAQAFMLGLVLESQSHLDSYKATVHKQFLELMRPLLDDDLINELDNEVVCPLRIEVA
eukprot:gnl/MRDRNA2_/MRDRNA2_27970_c0_seq1.p1 gnl/MRDRNA2_/MRDRNA2_27970_c0~~gnl/MRDRNA2_/MRDRNA2_27970_c0_seq1.p1  ORF type:complete len:348 (+),score=56.82 gnl/MRDRNA2_/MRDRNA2_27970_c0_seq1:52-1044(+)